MNFLFKHNLFTISFLALIPIYFSCVRSAINVKENERIADELISQANSYWNQRTDAKALDKAENLILKVLKKKPDQLEHVVLLAKIKFTRAYFQIPNSNQENKLFLEASEICKKAVVNHPDFLAIYNSITGDSTEKLFSSLSKTPNSVLPGLYWWGKNLAHYLNSRPVIERLNSRELLEVIMNRVLTLDPGFHYGGAYRFFGMLYSRIPGLDIEQSFSYFNQAIKSNPHYLANSVFLADFYHQKAGNREQFNKILTSVLSTNLTTHPEVMNDNWLYQKKAQKLLEYESSLFE